MSRKPAGSPPEDEQQPVPGSSPDDYADPSEPEDTYQPPGMEADLPEPESEPFPAIDPDPRAMESNLSKIVRYAKSKERDAQIQAKAEARQIKAEHNASARATSAETGAQFDTDARGVAIPRINPETGKQAFTPRKSPVRYDGQGKPYQVVQNEDGTQSRKIVNPDADAEYGENPDDPTDPNLYRKNKLQGWEPIDPEEGIHSTDSKLAVASAKHLHRRELKKIDSDRADLELTLRNPDRPRPLTPKQREDYSNLAASLAQPEPPPPPVSGFMGMGTNAQATAQARADWEAREADRLIRLKESTDMLASDDERQTLEKQSYELALKHKTISDGGPAALLVQRRKEKQASIAELPADQAQAAIETASAELQATSGQIEQTRVGIMARAAEIDAEIRRGVTSGRHDELQAERQSLTAQLEQTNAAAGALNSRAQDINSGIEARRQKEQAETKAKRDEMRQDPDLAPIADQFDALDAEYAQRESAVAAMPDGEPKKKALEQLRGERESRYAEAGTQLNEKLSTSVGAAFEKHVGPGAPMGFKAQLASIEADKDISPTVKEATKTAVREGAIDAMIRSHNMKTLGGTLEESIANGRLDPTDPEDRKKASAMLDQDPGLGAKIFDGFDRVMTTLGTRVFGALGAMPKALGETYGNTPGLKQIGQAGNFLYQEGKKAEAFREKFRDPRTNDNGIVNRWIMPAVSEALPNLVGILSGPGNILWSAGQLFDEGYSQADQDPNLTPEEKRSAAAAYVVLGIGPELAGDYLTGGFLNTRTLSKAAKKEAMGKAATFLQKNAKVWDSLPPEIKRGIGILTAGGGEGLTEVVQDKILNAVIETVKSRDVGKAIQLAVQDNRQTLDTFIIASLSGGGIKTLDTVARTAAEKGDKAVQALAGRLEAVTSAFNPQMLAAEAQKAGISFDSAEYEGLTRQSDALRERLAGVNTRDDMVRNEISRSLVEVETARAKIISGVISGFGEKFQSAAQSSQPAAQTPAPILPEQTAAAQAEIAASPAADRVPAMAAAMKLVTGTSFDALTKAEQDAVKPHVAKVEGQIVVTDDILSEMSQASPTISSLVQQGSIRDEAARRLEILSQAAEPDDQASGTSTFNGPLPSPADADTFKSLSNLAGSNSANALRDFVRIHPGIEKDYSSLDVPGKRMVNSNVISILEDNKILDAIVKLVPIDVVNMLGGEQFTPEMLRNNPAMFRDQFVAATTGPASDVKSSAMNRIVGITARLAAKVSSFNPGGNGSVTKESGATSSANNIHGEIVYGINEKSIQKAPQQQGAPADQAGADPQAGGQDRAQAENPAGEVIPPIPAGRFGAPITDTERTAAEAITGRLEGAGADKAAARAFATYYVRREGAEDWTPERVDAAQQEFQNADGLTNPQAISRAVAASISAQKPRVEEIHAGIVKQWGESYSKLPPTERKKLDRIIRHRLAPDLLAYEGAIDKIIGDSANEGGGGVGVAGRNFHFNLRDLTRRANRDNLSGVKASELTISEEIGHIAGQIALHRLEQSEAKAEGRAPMQGSLQEVATARARQLFNFLPKEVQAYVRGIREDETFKESEGNLGMEFFRMLLQRDIAVEDGKWVTADGAIITEQTLSPGMVEKLRGVIRAMIRVLGELKSTLISQLKAEGKSQEEIDRITGQVDTVRNAQLEIFRSFQKQADETNSREYRKRYAQPGKSNPESSSGVGRPDVGGVRPGRSRPANGGPGSTASPANAEGKGIQPVEVADVANPPGQDPAGGVPGRRDVTPETSETGYQFNVSFQPKGSEEIITETVRLSSTTLAAAREEQKTALLGYISRGTLKGAPTKLSAAIPAEPQEARQGPAAEPEVPEATPEAETPAAPKKRKASTRLDGATTPIITWLEEHGGIQSKKKAGTTSGGEYEQSGGVRRYGAYSKLIYGDAMPADVAVTGLVESGLMPDGSTADDLWVAIDNEIDGAKKAVAREEALGEDERLAVQYMQEFREATSKGPGKILANTSDMQIGQILDAGPSGRFIVDHITENGDVALVPEDAPDDGLRSQIIANGESLYLAKPIEDGMDTPFSIASEPTAGIGIATVQRALRSIASRLGLENVLPNVEIVGDITEKPGAAQASQAETTKLVEKKYREDLVAALNGKLPATQSLQLGRASEALRLAGLPDGPVYMRQETALGKPKDPNHPYPFYRLLKLAELLQNPILVHESWTQENAFVALLDAQHEGENFVAALHFRTTDQGIEITEVSSVYPRESQKIYKAFQLTEEGKKGGITYFDKEKARTWLIQHSGSNSPQYWLQNLGRIKTIRTNSDIVNEEPASLSRRNAAGQIEGYFDPRTGKTVLNASAISSPKRAMEVFLHEVVGHGGMSEALQGINPKGYENLKRLLQNTKREDGSSLWNDVQKRYPNASEATHFDEALARLAENPARSEREENLFKRIVDAIRQWLAQKGFTGWSNGDVEALIRRAADSARRGFARQDSEIRYARLKENRDQLGFNFDAPAQVPAVPNSDPSRPRLIEPADPTAKPHEKNSTQINIGGDLAEALLAMGREIPESELYKGAEGKAWGKRGGYATQEEQIREAKRQGHDGLIIRNTKDTYQDHQKAPIHDVVVAFSGASILPDSPAPSNGAVGETSRMVAETDRGVRLQETPEESSQSPVDRATARKYAQGVGASDVEEATDGISRTLQFTAAGRVGESGSYSQGDLFGGPEESGTGAAATAAGKAAAGALRPQNAGENPSAGVASQDLLDGLQGDWEALAREIDAKGRASSIFADLVNNRIPDWDVTGTKIESAEDVLAVMQPIRSPYFESLKVMVMDGNNNVAYSQILHVGSVNESVAAPARIFGTLARLREQTGKEYSSLIISHNHPSGDPSPSNADRRLQALLDEVARATGWDVTDHVITNGETYFSFHESGLGGTSSTGDEYKPATDEGTPADKTYSQKAPWEALRRSELQLMDRPEHIAKAAKFLRNANPDCAHILYLNTRLKLTAVERVSLEDFQDEKKRNAIVIAGMAREGGYAFAAEKPGEDPTPADRRIATSLREFAHAARITLVDLVITNTSVMPEARPYFSFSDSGLMEDGGSFGAAVNDEQTDFNFLPENAQQAQDDSEKTALARFQDELPQAMRIAAGYSNIPGVDRDEIQQTARLALAKASREFDPARGKAFAAMAGIYVRNSLRTLYKKEDLRRDRFPRSLDEPLGADTTDTRGDFTADPGARVATDAAAANEGRDMIETAISELPAKMQVAVRGFLADRKLDDIGRELGHSKQAVQQLQRVAFERIRRKLGEKGISSTSQIMSMYKGEEIQSRPKDDADFDDELDALMDSLANEAGDYQAAAAAEESSGAMKNIGRPDLAYGAENADVRGLDQFYTDKFIPETEAQWEAEAADMLAKDYEGTRKAIETAGLSNLPLSPAQTKAADQIARDLRAKMVRTGEAADRTAFNVFWYAYRSSGTAAGRAMAARRDPFKTPAERYREFLLELMLKPRKAAQKEIDSQTDPKEKAKLIDAETKALLEKLKAAGISPEDILENRVFVGLKEEEIVRQFESALTTKQKEAFRLMRKRAGSPEQIAKQTGLTQADVEGIGKAFLDRMRAQHFAKFKAGIHKQADVKIIRARGEGLFGKEVSDAEAEAAFKSWVEGMVGFSDVKKIGKPKFNIEDPAHVMRLARAIQSARGETGLSDMLYEWWIMNILSGPQTHVANVTGNVGMATLNLTLQRGAEAMINTIVRDSKSASLGEFRWLAKGLLPGLAKGFTMGARAWSAEHDFFEHTVLGTPLELDQWDKLGGTRSAIPGQAGKFIRIPGRALLFADSLFKTAIGQMEAGAFAYRLAKKEGLTGAALAKRVELLTKTRGEVIAENLAKSTPTAEMVEFFARQLARRNPDLDPADLVANRSSEAWTLAREQTAFDMAKAGGWTEQAWQQAVESAKVNTFQQDLKTTAEGGNIVEDVAAKLQNARFGNKLVGFFFPFVRTPFNVFRVGLRKSPLGSANLLAQATKGLYSMKNGRPYIDGHPELVRDLAEQAIAWGAFALLFAAAQGDGDDDKKPLLITGSQPFNDTSRGQRELNTRAFGGEYVIRIGGRNGLSIPYGRLEPLATVLGVTVDTIRSIKRNGSTADNMNALWAFISGQVNNKSFLQGMQSITDLMNGRKDPGSIGSKAALQFLVPNIIRQPMRNVDDYARDTRTAGPEYQLFPTGTNAEPKISVYGEPVKKASNPLARIFFQSPLATDPTLNQTDKLLLAWNRANPEEAWAPDEPKAVYRGRDGKNVDMTAEEARKFRIAAGRLASVKLRAIVTPSNSERPTKEDVQKVRNAFEDARQEAKERMFRSKI